MFILQARAQPRFLFVNVTVFGIIVHSQLLAVDHRRMELSSGSEWNLWQSWSPCSSTCGGGVATRVRRCLIRHPFGKPCPGDQRQYKVCATEDCPLGTKDFRQLQCAAYNGHQIPQIRGAAFEWVPFFGAPSPCELSCLAKGRMFYYNFGRVLDGTKCGAGSHGICINGQCLAVGCGAILGSELTEDVCGICGGKNSTCQRYQSVFITPHLPPGSLQYNEVTMIPAGATHIKVTDNSSNYLALQNRNYNSIINGNWAINWPGTYSAAGTKVQYRRSADHRESLEAIGPTKEDLHLMVLSMEQDSGIDYEYWLPNDQYRLYHGDRNVLRGAQRAAVHASRSFSPALPNEPTTVAMTTTPLPAQRSPARSRGYTASQRKDRSQRNRLLHPSRPGNCGKCQRVRGRSNRVRQYCERDFALHVKVINKRIVGLETCYDVEVMKAYKKGFAVLKREYLWVPNTCDCPRLVETKQYVVMAHRHVNYERTLNRVLLQKDSFVRRYRPQEDRLMRGLDEECEKRGYQLRGNTLG
ncbi:ADAMTS-like protein 5 isoform X1 [Hemiscyllium ocellatum]|uniref:ADAMTS-like protein 5 isoform X1 n=1 Tax=Hemiscyllium ocellatum TaxID=170820 RepID=UPI0029662B3F|nr:ADAMTS-like protein 5 isoform X1 [Hemiscyllium ocellatum]